jgi:hypothetical protein
LFETFEGGVLEDLRTRDDGTGFGGIKRGVVAVGFLFSFYSGFFLSSRLYLRDKVLGYGGVDRWGNTLL